MRRTNNIRVRNAHSSGSALLCHAPGCYRTFTTTSGKTQHIRRMHPLPRRNRSETPIRSSRPATPVPFGDESEMESSPQRRHVEIEDITGREDEYEDIYMPESPRLSPGARSEEPPVPEHNRHSSSPHQSQRATSRDHEVRDPPSTTRIFHPDLNGKLPGSTQLFKRLTILQGIPCDKDGNAVPQGTPPPPYDTDNGPDDWTPYENRAQFELADYIFTKNQTSAGGIDHLLNIWAATLVGTDREPPFLDHNDLYCTIDSTPLGDVKWESFTLSYSGEPPDGEVLPWMKTKHEVWFRDPRLLVHNLLANTDFAGEIDTTPYQEYDADNNHRYQNFMSGNWSWKQAVRFLFFFSEIILITNYRTSLLPIPTPTGQCLSPSSSEATRPLFLSLPVTRNTGQFIYQSEISITM